MGQSKDFISFEKESRTENPVRNGVGPDQTLHYVASDPGLHCLPMILLWVSR